MSAWAMKCDAANLMVHEDRDMNTVCEAVSAGCNESCQNGSTLGLLA